MQEVHITCPVATVPIWVNRFQQQLVSKQEEVILIDFGCSRKRQTGYIVLCWAHRADQAVIDQLQADRGIEDVSVYTIPEEAPSMTEKANVSA